MSVKNHISLLLVLLCFCTFTGCRINRWNSAQSLKLLNLVTNYQNSICSKRVQLFDETRLTSVWVYDAIVIAEENEEVNRLQKEIESLTGKEILEDTIKIISRQQLVIDSQEQVLHIRKQLPGMNSSHPNIQYIICDNDTIDSCWAYPPNYCQKYYVIVE